MLYDTKGEHEKDVTRDLIYGAIEIYLNNQGKSGRQCLLKSICDAAEHLIYQGNIFDELIHLVLTYVFRVQFLSLFTFSLIIIWFIPFVFRPLFI